MSTLREPPYAQGSLHQPLQPLKPRLAVAQQTSPRRSPVPRVANNARNNTPPATNPIPLRKQPSNAALRQQSPFTTTRQQPPLVALRQQTTPVANNTTRSPVASGRSTPIRPLAPTTTSPRSPARFSKFDGPRSATPIIATRAVQSPLGQTMSRPGISRVLTASSAPAAGNTQQPILQKQDLNNGGLPGPRPMTALSLEGRNLSANAKPQRPATLVKANSFFHADEIPVRSSSPEELDPLETPKKFVYANQDVSPQKDSEVGGWVAVAHKPMPLNRPINEQMKQDLDLPGPGTLDTTKLSKETLSTQDADLVLNQASIPSPVAIRKEDNTSMTSAVKPLPSQIEAGSPQDPIVSNQGSARRASNIATTTTNTPLHTRRKSVSSAVSNTPSKLPVAIAESPISSPHARSARATSVSIASPSSPPSIQAVSTNVNTEPTLTETDLTRETTAQDNNPTSARHERKLLDLEISNSSLLALNRSLEREVTKQKAELRRLRRASRAGSIGMFPMDFGDEGDASISEVGSVLSGQDEDQHTIDGPGSPQTPSRRNVGRKSLPLVDLAKHKHILADNQLVNLSIQRCLLITDSLIRDSQMALERGGHVQESAISIFSVASPATQEKSAPTHNVKPEKHLVEDEESAEREHLRHMQEDMYTRQAEAEALIHAWQGLGVGVRNAGVEGVEAQMPGHELPRSRKDANCHEDRGGRQAMIREEGNEEKQVDHYAHAETKELDVEVEDRDSGVDLSYAYSDRSARLGVIPLPVLMKQGGAWPVGAEEMEREDKENQG